MSITAQSVSRWILSKAFLKTTKLTNMGAILLGCIYRLPSSLRETSKQINKSIETAKNSLKSLGGSSCLIGGDFNHCHIRNENVDSGGRTVTLGIIDLKSIGDKRPDQYFLGCLENCRLTQLVTFPTYRHSREETPKNILDLVITDEPARLVSLMCQGPLANTSQVPGHFMLIWTFLVVGVKHCSEVSGPRLIWSKANNDDIT